MGSGRELDLIEPGQVSSLHGLFLERVRRSPDQVAYQYFDFQLKAWQTLTWRQVAEQVACWQAALIGEGLNPGDRVGIMLRNCPQWVMFDQAAMSLGLVVVPLYTVDRPENVAYITQDAGLRVLLIETREQWQTLRGVAGQMATVQRFVSLNDCADQSEPRLVAASAWLPERATLQAEPPRDIHTLATIMYTSGTTGRPKGVMLSHSNILHNARDGLKTFDVLPDDSMLSFLPLSHAFERTVGYYLNVMAGGKVAFARSISHLADDLQFIQPTILISVPRIFERIHGGIRAKLEQAPGLQQWLFALTLAVGWRQFEYAQGRTSWHPALLLWPLLKRLVADKVTAKLGGRLRLSISGGAALPPDISRFFISLGLNVLQGYGLTETSPVISVNLTGSNLPDSVGPPLEGTQIAIGEQGALLVRGSSVMLGYWNNPEATRAMISADGWLNTGDTARIAETGHIYITGRLKEIIVMSNGEKVPPGDMESAILRDPLFEQVMVYGEASPFLVAIAVVNAEVWQRFAAEVGIQPDMPESLLDSRVEQRALARITRQINDFPGYAKIRRVLLLREPWTIEGGQLTPTLKLRRNRVVAQYEDELRRLYGEHGRKADGS
ncbi:long-chain fatty acid--CoA ligase [Ferriphaselus sp. R-1]|uniref:AMP-dependent synthetase/ligase n=1 Tax=Ferriphaselus sp. R-1 TaxID=1485544 RepID=UPI00054EF49A|nr:long-chain fatty acid--CoA ligase [Ferriphaselus sp. R-1]